VDLSRPGVRPVLVAVQLLLPAPALALTFGVQGSVTKLLSYPPPGISVALGDPVSGTFRFDPATATCSPGGSCGYSLRVGGIQITGSLDEAVVVDNPPASEDRLLVADFDAQVPGFACSGDCTLLFEFRDPGGTALSSGDLEAALLALPTWPGSMLLDVGNFTTLQEIQAALSSVALVPDANPVPALGFSWPLVGVLCGAGVAALRGRPHARR
jgi:hypothetical protein